MVYNRIIFEDYVTPFNASVMNRLDRGIDDNQSLFQANTDRMDYHENTSDAVHKYYNIQPSFANNSVAHYGFINNLNEEILTHRKQFVEIIGTDVWNSSSWYGVNLSALVLENDNLSNQAYVTLPNNISANDDDISNLSSDIINLSSEIVNLSTNINNLASETHNRVFSLSWNGQPEEDQYIIGGDSVDTLYLFNTSVALIDARFNLKFNNTNGYLRLVFNNSAGEIANWSSAFTNSSYYRDSIDLLNTDIAPNTDGLSVQTTNISQLNSMFLTLNYKENF